MPHILAILAFHSLQDWGTPPLYSVTKRCLRITRKQTRRQVASRKMRGDTLSKWEMTDGLSEPGSGFQD
jgi:hypothetical protein